MTFFWRELHLNNLVLFNRNIYEIFVLLTVFVVFTIGASGEECKTLNPCLCRFRNGSVIDLQSLGTRGDARWQKLNASDFVDDYAYYYNPCADFKLPKSGPAVHNSSCAQGVAACQVFSDTTYISLGSQKSAKFEWNPRDQRMHLCYETEERKTDIKLICDPNPDATDTLVVVGEVPPHSSHYEMSLTSKCACVDLCGHRGLSAGSIIIILFSTFVILYLVFGMVHNSLTRGAQGWELIPNYEFWQDFPLLVRDGCVYVASGCKPDTTYERI